MSDPHYFVNQEKLKLREEVKKTMELMTLDYNDPKNFNRLGLG